VAAVRERLDAEYLRLVGRWNRGRAWEADGSLSAASWLEHRTPASRGEARRLVKTARLVDRHEVIGDALADGAITTPHIDAMGKVSSAPREPLLADHADTLVAQAETLSVHDFTTVMRRWAALADDEQAADTFDQKWPRRHFHASVTLDGWIAGDFFLDPAAGTELLNTLDHLEPPDPHDAPDGPRTLSQRRADAVADLASWYRSGAQPGGNPPNLNVVVDVATLNGDTPPIAALLCDLEGVGPVTRRTLDSLTCNATLSRVVVAGASRVLDMGRESRLATAAHRRALAIRDRRCRFPGCHRQPNWCDVHHILGWFSDVGPTDLDNLSLQLSH